MDHLLPLATSSLRTPSPASASVATADRGAGGVRDHAPGDRSRDGFGAAMREAMGRDGRSVDRGHDRPADRADGRDRGDGHAGDRSQPPAEREGGPVSGPDATASDVTLLRASEDTLTVLDGGADAAAHREAGWLLLLGHPLPEAAATAMTGEGGATGSDGAGLVEGRDVAAVLEQVLADVGSAGGGGPEAPTAAVDPPSELTGTLSVDVEAAEEPTEVVDADQPERPRTDPGEPRSVDAGTFETEVVAGAGEEVPAAASGESFEVAAGMAAAVGDATPRDGSGSASTTDDGDALPATRLRGVPAPRGERSAVPADAAPRPPASSARAAQTTDTEFRAVGLSGDGLQGVERPRAEALRPPTLPAGVQRVLDLVAQLEKLPPPRQLVLELGDLRVRVSLEDGHVRLSVLSGNEQDGDELLEDARDALAQQGFDLSEERDDAPGQDLPAGPDRSAPTRDRPSGRAGRTPAGLRL